MSTRTKKIWRLLEPGEIIKSGDEFLLSNSSGGWASCTITVGCIASGLVRRQIEIPAPHPFDEWFENYNRDASHVAYEPAARAAWNAAIDAAISSMDGAAPFLAICELEELKK